ncbi:MAG: hypothetical protein ACTSX2_05455 [Candidatus Thorarchaeota archaeon]
MMVRKFSNDDMMLMIVSVLMIGGIIYVWMNIASFWFALGFTILILFSLYYQVMVWLRQTNFMMVTTEIEDRYLNELSYQVIKRGYTFKVNSKRQIRTNVPRWKKPYIKLVTLFFVVLFPAWNYRDFDEEDEIWEDE